MSQPIFPVICRQVARAVGENILIPSSSLSESNRIRLLSVMIMTKKRRWIWFTTVDYDPCFMSLEDVLIDQSQLKLNIKTSKIDSYVLPNTCAMKLMSVFGGGIRGTTVDAKFGELLLQEIENASFIAELKDRRIDMKNTFIDQIKKPEEVLCVVKSVLNTSDKVAITHRGNTDVNIKLSEKPHSSTDSSNTMTINTENTLAFKVCQLIVDENSGEITPDMSGAFLKTNKEGKESKPQSSLDSSHAIGGGYRHHYDEVQEKSKLRSSLVYSAILGGFSSDVDKSCAHGKGFSTIDQKEMSNPLTNLQEILKPLHDCTEAESQTTKRLLLGLMTSYSDVVALSKILSKAEHGCLNEDKDTLDKQFINNDTVWSILKCVGVQTKIGRVLYEGKATAILIAVAYMIDAILEIENDDLDTINNCDEQQLKTLSNIFGSAVVSRTTIAIDVDPFSVLNESVTSFLKRLKFIVCSDYLIQPPKTPTCVAECIFCVLYCLSS